MSRPRFEALTSRKRFRELLLELTAREDCRECSPWCSTQHCHPASAMSITPITFTSQRKYWNLNQWKPAISHFDQSTESLWDAWRSPFSAVYELGFIMNPCVWTSEYPINCTCKPRISEFSNIGETVYKRYGRVHLLLYVNRAPLRINMTEDSNSR